MTIVLLVDDEKLIQRSLEKTLLRAGFDVLTAADCKSGSEIFAQNIGEVNIAVLDLNMPVMDGFQVLEMLKTEDRLSKMGVKTFSWTQQGEGNVFIRTEEESR